MQVRFVRSVVLVVAWASPRLGAASTPSATSVRPKPSRTPTTSTRRATTRAPSRGTRTQFSSIPDLGFAYFFLGNSYDNLYKPAKKGDAENDGYLTKAAGHYRTAIDKLATSTDPKEKQIRRYSFEYLIALYGSDKLNDFAKAEPIAKELIAVDPTEPATYQMLAKLYEDQGRFDEAEAQFLKAIDVNPKEPTGYQILAGFYNAGASSRRRWRPGTSALRWSRTTPRRGTPSASTIRTRSSATRSCRPSWPLEYTVEGRRGREQGARPSIPSTTRR